jgi:ABC-2 type transport system permease protein
MRIILILIKKEFLQIFRNPVLWKLVTFLPIAQLLVFPFAADLEIKELHVAFLDYDHSSISRSMREALDKTTYFTVHHDMATKAEANLALEKNQVDVIIEIPPQCEYKLIHRQQPIIGVSANAINTMKASIGMVYLQQFFEMYFQKIARRQSASIPTYAQIDIAVDQWFNKKMDYKNIFVPGILAVLVSMVGAMLSTLNIVREKELGTIEQINITPIAKGQFFLGKMLPFWIIGMLEFGIGLCIMVFLFGIPVQGSIAVLLLFTAIFLLAMLGLGFMVSIFAENQVQSMFVIIFFFIVFILLSGLFSPLDGMPTPVKVFNLVNPIAHFMNVLKCIILKGSMLKDLWGYFWGISCFAVVVNAITIVFYKNRAA